MANTYNFPYFSPPPPFRPIPPPPPPPIRPPPPHPISPPPPHVLPPPPPHVLPPPPPPHFLPPPPPPHVLPPPPPSPPDHHPTIIIIVFISFGSLLLLVLALVAFCWFLKKRKNKVVEETEIINFDEHLKVQEAIVKGPHGTKTVALSVEDDLHVNEVDTKKSKSLSGEQNIHAKPGEVITPKSLEEGMAPSSPSHQQHSKQNP